MNKVYVLGIELDEYSPYLGIFSSRENAEAAIEGYINGVLEDWEERVGTEPTPVPVWKHKSGDLYFWTFDGFDYEWFIQEYTLDTVKVDVGQLNDFVGV